VLSREEKVGEGRGVGKALKNRVQEAGVAKVVESGADGAGLRPGQLNLLLAEENLCRQPEAVVVLGDS
jgi:hypothetical protein